MLNDLKGTIRDAKNFNWGEATRRGTIKVPNKAIYENICTTAAYMERIREILGNKKIIVTSWYRSPQYNSRIGGANNSQHLSGLAVDFYCNHLSSTEIYNILNIAHGCKGGLGRYPGHVHIDLRGVKARWTRQSY